MLWDSSVVSHMILTYDEVGENELIISHYDAGN